MDALWDFFVSVLSGHIASCICYIVPNAIRALKQRKKGK